MVPTGFPFSKEEYDPSSNYGLLAGRVEGQDSQNNNMRPERYDIRSEQDFSQQQQQPMYPYDFPSSNNYAMPSNDNSNTFQYGYLEIAAGQTQDFASSSRPYLPDRTPLDYGKVQTFGNLVHANNNVPTEQTQGTFTNQYNMIQPPQPPMNAFKPQQPVLNKVPYWHADFLDPNMVADVTSRCAQSQYSVVKVNNPSMVMAPAGGFGYGNLQGLSVPRNVMGNWDWNPNIMNNTFGNAANAAVGCGNYPGGGCPIGFESTLNDLNYLFETQQKKFPQLPMDAHYKIQSMSGYHIINVFQVTLIRFLENDMIDSQSHAFAVFTCRPETGQIWLMAFAFKKDRKSIVVKFNRLLTTNLKVTVIGQTAIELESSRLSRSFMGEQFVFSFLTQEEAKSFLDEVNHGCSQVWNATAKNKQKVNSRPGNGYNNNSFNKRYNNCNNGGALASSSTSMRGNSRPGSRLRRNPIYCNESIINCVEKKIMDEIIKPLHCNNNDELPFSLDSDFKFSTELTVFMRMEPEDNKTGFAYNHGCSSETQLNIDLESPCYEIGAGILHIFEVPNSFDEIAFVSTSKRLIFSHKIYSWNELVMDNQQENDNLDNNKDNVVCAWNGMTTFAKEAEELPKFKQFKVTFDSQEKATEFYTCFSNARDAAKHVKLGN